MALYQSLGVRQSQNGMRIASGVVTPNAPVFDQVTGLSTVDHCIVEFEDPPVITCLWASSKPHATTGGTIVITQQQPTTPGNATPIDATTFRRVFWLAVGK